MPDSLAKKINTHQYPKLYYRFPFLLRLHHLFACATTLRVWYTKKYLRKLLKTLPDGFNFYDAGCGAGDFIIPYLMSYPAASFVGSDKVESNIEVCTAYCRANKINNAVFIKTSVEKYVPDDLMDLIICVTVLQYVEDDIEAISNFYQTLKTGGKLFIYVPVYHERVIPYYTKIVQKYFKDHDYDIEQEIKRHYTPDEIFRKLRDTGFSISSGIYSYGLAGKLSYELFSLGLFVFKKLRWLPSVLFLIVFVIVVYPFIFTLMFTDYLKKHKIGNGMIIVAQKD